jgi:hypothetical protein
MISAPIARTGHVMDGDHVIAFVAIMHSTITL